MKRRLRGGEDAVDKQRVQIQNGEEHDSYPRTITNGERTLLSRSLSHRYLIHLVCTKATAVFFFFLFNTSNTVQVSNVMIAAPDAM
jgi:hypothetical protein